jgi:hypothetical protein
MLIYSAVIILGRHWGLFCEALSYLQFTLKNAYFHLEFDATRLSRICERAGYRRLFDASFMQKTQKSLLEQLGSCLRGAGEFSIFTVDDEELAESITHEVTRSPWDDVPAWLGYLENSIALAKQATDEGKLLEASGAFEHILERLMLISDPDPIYSKYKAMFDSCSLGMVRCYLLQWQSPPPGASELWYMNLDTIAARELIESKQAEQSEFRALHLLYSARLRRLNLVRHRYAKIMQLESAPAIASMLLQAEDADAENKEVIEEGQKLLELIGLEGKTIREVENLS